MLRPGGTLLLADEVHADPPLRPEEMRKLIAQTFYPHVPVAEGVSRLATFGEWPLAVKSIVEMLSEGGFTASASRMHPIVTLFHAVA